MHVDTQDLAHGVTIEICGRYVTFARTLENLRRVESAAGAAAAFAIRLDARAAPHAEIVRVYTALLRGVPDEPPTRDLEAWAFTAGSRHAALAQFCFSLTMSSDELDAVVKARNLAAGTKPKAEVVEDRHPFARTAAPIGPPSSASDIGSASLRERLTRHPFTN